MKTKAGTELPIMDIKGKPYLQVAYRILWMREEHPGWGIQTEPKEITDVYAIFKASIIDETGRVISTAHKFENSKGFPDFIEKAETGAVGRALGLSGFGTQFCADELDEKDRLADSPMMPVKKNDRIIPEQPGANDGVQKDCNHFTFGGLKNQTWGGPNAPLWKCDEFITNYFKPGFWDKKRKPEHNAEFERYEQYKETLNQLDPLDMKEEDLPF